MPSVRRNGAIAPLTIIEATRAGELLPRAYDDPQDWRCRMCSHSDRAVLGDLTRLSPAIAKRSCAILFAGYRRRDGEIVATVLRPAPHAGDQSVADFHAVAEHA